MSGNKIKNSEKNIEENCAQLPDWYWEYGLHDAFIRSVTELQLIPDYKEKNYKYNCLEIELDCRMALYERDIRIIRLYNYKIKTPEININSFAKPVWLSDSVKKSDDKHYILRIEIETERCNTEYFAVEFEFAEIERK